ncbi:MAG TPA: hypothetical protein VF263_00865 [Longimicrobiaceae bacterium]
MSEQFFETPDGTIRVRTPGTRTRVTVRDRASHRRGLDAAAGGGELERAIAEAGLEPHAVDLGLHAAPVDAEPGRMPLQRLDGSTEPLVQLDVPVPAEHGLVALTEDDNGVVQWHLPASPRRAAEKALRTGPQDADAAARTVTFYVPAPVLPAGAEALDAGAVTRGLHFFRFPLVRELVGAAGEKVLTYLAREVESRLKKEGFKHFGGERHLAPVDWSAPEWERGGRALLLVHGIFSSVDGAFGGLLRDAEGRDTGLLPELRAVYGERIVGYDHWTVAKTPLTNAMEMLGQLPDGLELDVVCHSRGALVVRSLLEHPHLHQAFNAKAEVRNAIFVAGANQGSALAHPANWERLLNLFTLLSTLPGLPPQGVGVVRLIVEVVRVLAHGVAEMPSVAALAPDRPDRPNPFIRALNSTPDAAVEQLCVVRAHFDRARHPLLAGLDLGIDFLFDGAANDLVVPFLGAGRFDPARSASIVLGAVFGSDAEGQGEVFHTNLFHQPQVRDFIRDRLLDAR